MSKSKSDIIQKIYKDKYLCKQGHTITWNGKTNIFSKDLVCEKCGHYGELVSPLRWRCSQCNTYYCSKCYELIIDKLCPMKHKYKFYKQASLESSSTFTCDICSKILFHKDGVLFDKDCDITICPKCYYNSCDIPEILED